MAAYFKLCYIIKIDRCDAMSRNQGQERDGEISRQVISLAREGDGPRGALERDAARKGIPSGWSRPTRISVPVAGPVAKGRECDGF